jgi:heptosyltransferase-2
MTENPEILIVRMSSLGDIVLTSTVCRNIKAYRPNARITFLVKKKFSELARQIKYADEIIIYKNIFKTLKEISFKNFTHYLDLHSNFRSIIIGIFSRIKNKTRYKKNSLARRIFVKFKIITPALQRHTLTRYLETLKKWNIPVKYTAPVLHDWNYKTVSTAIPVGKIAIMQTAFLGDAVLTVPLVEKTAQIFKNAKITIITRPETEQIFNHLPQVTKVIIDNKKNTPRLESFAKLLGSLKSGKFDMILIPHRSLRSALAAFLAKIPVRVGFTSSAGSFLLTKKVPFSWLLHDSERNLCLLKPFETDFAVPHQSDIKNDDSSKEYVLKLLKDNGLAGTPLAAVHAGSVWFTKRWPAQNYAELIQRLWRELGIKSVIIGTKSDFELAEKIINICGRTCTVNLTDRTNISQLMALMENLKLFVTNDSGPMHIAAAFDVATVAIFGPTTKELGFFPCGKNSVVVEKKLKCRPCSLHGTVKCPRGHFLCMRLITPSEIFAECKKLI